MSYAEKEMSEQIESGQSSEPEDEDPRVNQFASEYFKEFSEILPDANPVQVHKLLEVSLDRARKKVAAINRTEQQETRITNLRERTDRDPHNPDVYSNLGFYRVMKGVLSEAKRKGKTIAFLAGDLDFFKEYNDTAGHTAGNNALGLAGQLMRNVVRPEDIVARLHGDEYVVVLPGENLESGILVAERIRQAITEMPALLDTKIKFSMSLGVAMLGNEVIQADYTSRQELVTALDQAYNLADQAHYAGAKMVGKNKIGVMAPDGKTHTAIIAQGAADQLPTIAFQKV